MTKSIESQTKKFIDRSRKHLFSTQDQIARELIVTVIVDDKSDISIKFPFNECISDFCYRNCPKMINSPTCFIYPMDPSIFYFQYFGEEIFVGKRNRVPHSQTCLYSFPYGPPQIPTSIRFYEKQLSLLSETIDMIQPCCSRSSPKFSSSTF